MKILKFVIISALFISCANTNLSNISKYEIVYNAITRNANDFQPFKEYGSDASGTKIIPNIYRFTGKFKDFSSNAAQRSNLLEQISKKYSRKDWRKDADYRTLKTNEVKNFHGPVDYMYFSEIRNDSLKVQVLGNPFLKYEMTTGKNYLIIFKGDSIKSMEKWSNYYD